MWTRRETGIALLSFLMGAATSWLLAGGRAPVAPVSWLASRARREPRVLVAVVGAPAAVGRVQRAVSADRIVAMTPQGFAVREGRVVVASVEDAGPLITMAGWQERAVDVLDIRRASARSGRREPDAKLSRMAELMQKPTLTLAEAREALRLL